MSPGTVGSRRIPLFAANPLARVIDARLAIRKGAKLHVRVDEDITYAPEHHGEVTEEQMLLVIEKSGSRTERQKTRPGIEGEACLKEKPCVASRVTHSDSGSVRTTGAATTRSISSSQFSSFMVRAG